MSGGRPAAIAAKYLVAKLPQASGVTSTLIPVRRSKPAASLRYIATSRTLPVTAQNLNGAALAGRKAMSRHPASQHPIHRRHKSRSGANRCSMGLLIGVSFIRVSLLREDPQFLDFCRGATDLS